MQDKKRISKKKRNIVLATGVLFIIIGILVFHHMPFITLTTFNIQEVRITKYPGARSVILTKEETKEFVKRLRYTPVYYRDESFRNKNGRGLCYYITKNNGQQIEILECSPNLVIDGKGYLSSYWKCENISQFGQEVYYKE